MKSMGAQTIIAVDVGATYGQMELDNYGDYLSGWWLLWKKINPFTEPAKVQPYKFALNNDYIINYLIMERCIYMCVIIRY